MTKEKVYSFEGHVIRLTEDDYNRWYESFADLASEEVFYNKLVNLDDWLKKKGITEWFFVVSSMLAKWRNELHTKRPS